MAQSGDKYRCVLHNRIVGDTIPMFFFAENDTDARNRLILFVEMLIGTLGQDIENVVVGFDPVIENTVTGAIVRDEPEKNIPVLTAQFHRVIDAQAGQSQKSTLDRLKDSDLSDHTI